MSVTVGIRTLLEAKPDNYAAIWAPGRRPSGCGEQRQQPAAVLRTGPAGREVRSHAGVMLVRVAVLELALKVEVDQREDLLAAHIAGIGVQEALDVRDAVHWNSV